VTDGIGEALVDALRPIVAALVAEEVARQIAEREPGEPPPFLTVAEYARRYRSTPAAVRARIRRGRLQALRPPGGREYLIPSGEEAGGHDDG
jgi:hypothetical protein